MMSIKGAFLNRWQIIPDQTGESRTIHQPTHLTCSAIEQNHQDIRQ